MGGFNIPLMVDKPQFTTPVEAQRNALGLKQLAGSLAAQERDRQLDEQRRQMNEIAIKEAEEKQKDADMLRQHEKIATDAFKANGNDWLKARKAIVGKVDPRVLKRHDDELDAYVKAEAAKSKEERETNSAHLKLAGDEILGLLQTPTELLPSAYKASLARLASNGVDVSKYPPDHVPSPDELKALAATVGYAKQVSDLAKAKADEDEKTRSTAAAKIQAGREEVARLFSPAIVTDQETWDAFRNEIDDSGPNGGLRRQYPKKWDSEKTPQLIARLARTQAQQDAFDEKNKPKQDTSISEVELALKAARGDKEAQKALEILAKQKLSERPAKDDKTDDKLTKRFDDLQKRVDSIQTSKDKIASENEELGSLSQEYGAELKELYSADEDERDIKRIRVLEDKQRGVNAKIKKNQAQFDALHTQQEAVNKQKDSLYGNSKFEPAAKKTASMADVAAYAEKKGISKEAAKKEFEKANFEVK